jgi:hypothetical protein
LFDDGAKHVSIAALSPGQATTLHNPRGLELLVVSGTATLGGETLAPQSWGRFPAGQDITITAGPAGARLWLKDAPLLHADLCQLPESA